MNKSKRIGRMVLCLIISFVMIMTLIPRMPAGLAYAAEPQGPARNKDITDNGDGTYKLSLDVTGESENDPEVNKANVVIVLDISGSMNFPASTAGVTRAGNNTVGRYGGYIYNDYGQIVDYARLYYRSGNTYIPEGTGTETYRHGTVYQATDMDANGNVTWTEYRGDRYNFTNNATRLDQAKTGVKNLITTLLAQNSGKNNDMVEIAFTTFSTYSNYESPTSATADGWTKGTSTTALHNIVDNVVAAGSTNWDESLYDAKALADKKTDNDKTYIVFFSDGEPTIHNGNNGSTVDNHTHSDSHASNTWNTQYIGGTRYDREAAYNEASKLNGDEYDLYGIFAYGDSTGQGYMRSLVSYGNYGDNNHATGNVGGFYFSADKQEDIDAAFAAIASSIARAVGISDVLVEDGTTNKVSTSSGMVSLINVVPDSYDYWMSWQMPPGSNNITMLIDGVEREYTVTASDENVVISWDGGSTSYKGTITGNVVKIKWESKTGFYDYAPPAATFNESTGAVDWDLEPVGTLLDGVTYTVTFDVYPTQTVLDYRARLENGEAYDTVVPAEAQQYFDANGNLKTNTQASLTYDDTRPDVNVNDKTVYYTNPDPVETKSSTMTLKKTWEGGAADVKELEMTVMMDGKVFNKVKLTEEDPAWTATTHISVGIIKDGEVLAGAEGHDFSFAELDDNQYHWELDAPTVRPMLIDGGGTDHTPTMLVKVDAKHPAPSGATKYTIGGATYYADSSAAGLTAVNHRRSNLNLTKVVTGEDAPEGAKFPFTLTVNNSKAPATEPTDDPEHNSDYWVWFSIYDTAENKTVYDANVTGATAETRTVDTSDSRVSDFNYDEETGLITYRWNGSETLSTLKYVSVSGTVYTGNTGYYYAPSGSEIGVDMEADWNLRFTNLPSGTTYTFEEELAENFAFKSAELTEGVDTTFNGAQTTTGTVQNTKTSYTVKYTNDYALTDLEITKVWEDNNNQDGKRLTPEQLAAKLTLAPAVSGKAPTVVDNKDNTYTITYTGLPRYNNNQEVTYTVTESEVDGYTTSGSPAVDHGTITNTHTPESTSVSAKKEWDDQEDAKDKRPESITFNLMKGNTKLAEVALDGEVDEVPTGKTVVGYESAAWTATFINLPKYENGQEITYTVTEAAVENYSTTTSTADGVTTIKNTYALGDLEISKTVEAGNGDPAKIAAKEFTFTVTLKDSEGTALTGEFDYTIAKADGTTSTGKITSGGSLKLKGGEKATVVDIPGGTSYEVTETAESGYTTTKTGDTGTIPENNKVTAAFTNTYNATPGPAQIPVKKVVTAAEGLSKPTITTEYTFTLADDPDVEGESPLPENKTVTSNGDGVTVLFDSVTYNAPGTYSYQVTESGSVPGIENDSVNPKKVTVVVTDDGNGRLTAVANNGVALEFDNAYKVTPVEVRIPVTKIVSVPQGMTGPENWSYDITLAAQGTAPTVETMSGTVTKTSPSISFGPISFAKPGTYTYTVTEEGTVPGVTNESPATKTITVVVSDNGNGTMSAVVNGGNDVTFTNTYGVQPTTASFPVKKVVSVPKGVDGPAAWSYDITVAANGDAPAPTVASQTVDQDEPTATFTFAEGAFTTVGTYTYTVTESGDVTGVYDDPDGATGKTVTVTVSDNGDGTLTATADSTAASPLTFTNQYKQAVAHATVTKVYDVPEGLTGPNITGEYTFTLTGNGNAPMPAEAGRTVTNDGGNMAFGDIVFNAVGTYTYTVTESGTVAGVTNDSAAATGKTVTIIVDEDEDGNLYVTDESVTNVTFTNTYSATPAKASFPVKKELSVPAGLTPADITGKFTFTLAAGTNTAEGETQTPMPTVTELKNPAADGGTVTFGEIEFAKEGTYTYTVTESGKVDGITNDATATKTVTVTVKDNKDGTMTATPSSTTGDPLTFTNGYSVKQITANIPVLKTLTIPEYEGATAPNITQKYTFTLAAGTNTAAGGIATPMPAETELKNPAADGGAVSFGAITYTAPGTYNYTVTETGTVPGVTNDQNNPRTVQVVVTDNGDGSLSAVVNNGQQVTFVNDYKAAPVEISFPVKKEVSVPEGFKGPKSWSYDINVAANDGAPVAETMTGRVTDKSDTATFGPFKYTQPGTYTYKVTESGKIEGVINDEAATTGKTVTVTVTDDGSGKLQATVSSTAASPLTFTNQYKTEPTTVSFPAKKVLSVPEGLEGPAEWSYTITLAGAPAAKEMTGTVTNEKDTVTFEGFTFDKPGTYTYTLTESGTYPGVTNDTGTKTVTVTVVDNQDGTLTATADSTKDKPITFTNTYAAEKVTASFPVEKIMTIPQGLTGPADWSYDVKVAAQDGAPVATAMEGKVTKAAPSTTFGPFEYTAPGTYKYTVSETGTVKGVTNDKDAAGKTVTVVVKDGKDGKLVVDSISATEKEPLTFTNTYSVENTTASFPVKKDMVVPEGLTGPAKWSYDVKVEAQDGAPEARTMKGTVSNETDTVTFGDFTYSMPGTYKYTVSETGTIKGVTNDAQAAGKTVTVTVVDNGDGTLTATPDFNAEKPLTFTNTYSVEKTTAGFPVEKIMTVPEGLTGPADWSYAVKVAAQDGAPEAETMEGTVTKAEPSVTFDGFTYTMPGTYKYTVSEAGQVAGVANDAQAAGKNVTVTVVDNGDGTLTATPDFTEKAPLQFTNTYSVKETTASFPVKKNMVVPEELDGPESWSYEIKVEAKDGAPAAETMTGTVTDKADTVTFGEFTYTMPGTYKYTVSEAGDIAGVTNDKEAKGKEVTVTVVDNGDGTLTATADSTADAPLAFTNTYSVEKVIVDPPVKKILKDADLKDHEGEFTFKIEGKTAPEGVEEIPMPTNTEITNSKKFLKDGSTDLYEFGEIEYLVPGTYTYTVSEVGGKLDYIKYDGSEYTLTVTVTDNKDGTLSAKMDPEEGEMVFNNEYTAAGTFNIEAKKVLKGADLKDGQFTFTLEGPEGKLPETVSVKNKADGTVTFGPIAIDQNDVGKTFEYTITEVNDKQANVAYDAKKITAKVTVVDNHDGTLSVKTDYSDKATFTNKYEEPPVKTGDTTVIVPYIVIGLASIALLLMILFRRRKAN